MALQRLLTALGDGFPNVSEIQSILEEASDEELRGQQLFAVVVHAIKLRADSDVLQLLIRRDTNCAFLHDPAGSTLLHLLCLYDSLDDVMKLVFELNPAVVKEKDSEGYLPLHNACPFGDLETIQMLVSQYPESVFAMIASEGRYPLHMACEDFAYADVVHFLLAACPVIARVEDRQGKLPIHICAKIRVDIPEVAAELLINAYPEGACKLDLEGRNPLHLACMSGNWATARLLLARNYNAAHMRDATGALPVHYASKALCPLDFMQRLVEANPTCLEVQASNGRLPIHFACLGSAYSNVLQYLLDLYPDCIHVADEQGWLPLHVACRHDHHPDQIQLLVRSDPHTLLRKTAAGETPLMIAHTPLTNEYVFHGFNKEYLLSQQEIVVQAHHDAVEFVEGWFDFTDLILHKIQEFAQPPEVWHPSDENVD